MIQNGPFILLSVMYLRKTSNKCHSCCVDVEKRGPKHGTRRLVEDVDDVYYENRMKRT